MVDAPRNSQWNLPITVALKKDPSTWIKTPGRICLDPRALNSLLQSDRYPLPLISDIFEILAGKTFFCGIDLEQSFLQTPVHPSHRPKLAFTWLGRHLMFAGTPFGLKPTSAALQRVMNRIFEDSTYAKPFQDDVPVGSDFA